MEPAMAHEREVASLKFNPSEMNQRLAGIVCSKAWNTSCIDVRSAITIAKKCQTFPFASSEAVMHVAKDNQISSSPAAHGLYSDGKVAIPPIDMGMLPIATTDARCVGSETSWTTVSQKHKGPGFWCS
tara:strand:- start:126 stop:509 length:384 start_codon:yes stop_codon:yes gene_type:complete